MPSKPSGGPLKVLRRVRRRGKRIAVLVDGPNMLRRDLGIDLEAITEALSGLGRVKIRIVVLDRKAPDKLVEAVTNSGYRAVVSTGKVEVEFTMIATELMYSNKVDVLALATRNAAYAPIVYRAKELGKDVIVIGAEPGFSTALRKSADLVITLSPVDRDYGGD